MTTMEKQVANEPEVVVIDGEIRGTVIRRTADSVIVDVHHGIVVVSPERVTRLT